MSRLKSHEEHRLELIEKVKAVGQDLIDRAEDFVGDNIDFMTDFDIWIKDFESQYSSPSIEVSKSFASKNYIKKFQEEETHE